MAGEALVWNRTERRVGEPGMRYKWCWPCLQMDHEKSEEPGKRGWTDGGYSCEMQVKGGCKDENRLKLRVSKVQSQRAQVTVRDSWEVELMDMEQLSINTLVS